ncbi:DUF397 domain-containing protein [Actinocatenispora sera]|uniref:DUF397 domain-containing protein n=1 Tax=Actinocatenispora sera TaxID=390989 RepID=UPI0033EA605C
MASVPDFGNAKWRKSSTSDSGGCVEVAYADGYIGVRDTKDHGTGPVLTFNRHEWTAFLEGVGNREFTLDELSK